MDKLQNYSIIYYESKIMFKSEIDDVHAFPRANFECGMHMQEFFEINIITRGRGIHYIEDSCVQTQVGDVFIIPPKVKHAFKNESGLDVFHVLISDRFINKNMSDLQLIPSYFVLFAAEPLMRGKAENVLHLRLTDTQFESLNGILNIALECRNQLDPFDCLSRKGFVLLLISFLCRVYSERSGDLGSKNEADEAFLKAISHIHEHYFEKISVDTLARIANLSRSTFLRKFTDVCKMSPSEYIINRRIRASEYMLLNTSDSIQNIAFKCGFYDAAHFSRIFTKKNGISPSEYRKRGARS